MEVAIQKLAVVCFMLIGVSHIVHPRGWIDLFIAIRERGTVGAFINGFVHFPLGVLIVAFHDVWRGIPLVLTLIGYGLVIKGVVCFVFPSVSRRSMARVSHDRAWEFVVAGVFFIAIGGLLLYSLLRRL